MDEYPDEITYFMESIERKIINDFEIKSEEFVKNSHFDEEGPPRIGLQLGELNILIIDQFVFLRTKNKVLEFEIGYKEDIDVFWKRVLDVILYWRKFGRFPSLFSRIKSKIKSII